MSLIEIIPVGKENAVTMNHLRQVTGLSDREIRKQIQEVNESGEHIICRECQKGYYLPRTKAEAEHYIRYSHSYLVTLARKDRAMRKAVEKRFSNQMELEL